jgi:hypothetical protein
MSAQVFRYKFTPDVPIEDVEASMVLALLGAEALHGETEVQLSASHYIDVERRSCVIDAARQAGHDLNRLFLGFMCREFGRDCFQVERIATDARAQIIPAA